MATLYAVTRGATMIQQANHNQTSYLLLGSGPSLDKLPRHLAGLLDNCHTLTIACVNASIRALAYMGHVPDIYGVFEYKCGSIFRKDVDNVLSVHPACRVILSEKAYRGGDFTDIAGKVELLSERHLPPPMFDDGYNERTSGALMLAILAQQAHLDGGGTIYTLGLDGYSAGCPYSNATGGVECDSMRATQLNQWAGDYIAGVYTAFPRARVRFLEPTAYPQQR